MDPQTVDVDESGLPGAVVHVLSRLRDHIERLDDGAVTAMDDIAVVLRVLVGSGTGNNLLLQFRKEYGLSMPVVLVSAPPEEGPDVLISVGNVPLLPGEPAEEEDCRSLTFGAFLTSGVCAVDAGDAGRRRWTWVSLAKEYAEKWGGAHYQEVASPYLLALETQTVAGMSLPGFLLRRMAVLVWHIGQTLYLESREKNGGLPGQPVTAVYVQGGVLGAPRDATVLPRLLYLRLGRTDGDFSFYIDADHLPQELGVLTIGGGVLWPIRALSETRSQIGGSPSPVIAPRTAHWGAPSLATGREYRLGGRMVDPRRRERRRSGSE